VHLVENRLDLLNLVDPDPGVARPRPHPGLQERWLPGYLELEPGVEKIKDDRIGVRRSW